ncbi:MAG: hypothetical protein US83_C0010G0089 [Candidatus Falkowbacteria bacterium GW2011_GWC2_38_22]|uniref:DUF3006 domain-containing protein n=1 Tax=Candidatus Falkowbacteria bacterium GW2011_GWE1_38_31 TaxID=1618638 RepID=A0A0G0JU50_9BACT|nr:MAG: hypothetical protein US73_C0005G0089 [Candidatus Falkowbacteria bacterium GW2011_GWF2_38_1205]KKQ61053.1 MAG: hypothetical protein US83_C0010G0089 [Candidatus Falkowbacteria bacterium GW2011_GWC2_38_22]KKQ63418.1 MAG: hypothetical protein US84_C0006G0019 [Candidatus Falkowbacteria bacterium GW2011_GWF1_38_22]KKQ65511.1 MAG: hypothetical protein US87_C0007G0089 [Candidatus Falkowbacteria bacterium GW2011_GWE2_38_254]KKQ70182.1 MAG: hypothetical protein US91_C0006G0019 [Candidatus Falkowb
METKATIDRFENDKAVLVLKNKETIIWPKNLLPDNAQEGMVLEISIYDDKSETEKNTKQAKNILNEILNP